MKNRIDKSAAMLTGKMTKWLIKRRLPLKGSLRYFIYVGECLFICVMLNFFKKKEVKAIGILLYSVLLIIGGQLLTKYQYHDLNEQVDRFINAELNNEKIVSVDILQFTPGKGVYKQITLADSTYYPLFATNDIVVEDGKYVGSYLDSVKRNSFITKKKGSYEFSVLTDSQYYYFKIYTLKAQERLMRRWVFFIFFCVMIGGIYKYKELFSSLFKRDESQTSQ